MISTKLRNFLEAWITWAEAPKVEDTFHFMRNQGLCACLTSFHRGDVPVQLELIALLEKDFKGNYQFPFEGKLPAYWNSKMSNTLHKNPKRIAWVKAKLLS